MNTASVITVLVVLVLEVEVVAYDNEPDVELLLVDVVGVDELVVVVGEVLLLLVEVLLVLVLFIVDDEVVPEEHG